MTSYSQGKIAGRIFLLKIKNFFSREKKKITLFLVGSKDQIQLVTNAVSAFLSAGVEDNFFRPSCFFISKKIDGDLEVPASYFKVEVGEHLDVGKLRDFLVNNGFKKVMPPPSEPFDFSEIGDTIDINFGKIRIRVEFLFERIEKIYVFGDNGNIRRWKWAFIPSRFGIRKELNEVFGEIICFCNGDICKGHSKGEIIKEIGDEQVIPISSEDDVKELEKKGYRILRIQNELIPSFVIPSRKVVVLSSFSGGVVRSERIHLPQISYEELEDGMYVVHKKHGIGIFRGTSIEYGREFLKIEYRDSAMLYIPSEDIRLIHKYIGADNPILDELGGRTFALRKKRVRQCVEKYISDFLRAIALRKAIRRSPYIGADDILARVSESFPFEETPDKKKVIHEIVNDLCENDFPCDRVVVGDSGVGKTEVALRAACIVAYAGKQVALIAPTTPLALQHYIRIKDRLADLPFKIEMLSRLTPRKKEKEIVREIREGRVDIVIGTHKLINLLPIFKDLGLIIIDEEHRFGVSQKEKISRIKATVDVISLTATPIPRTLKMSLTGLKDISIISTKPSGRGRIFTSLCHPTKVKEVIEFELKRNGQVLYIYPYVSGQDEILIKLHRLFPDASINVLHGKMSEAEIEKIMLAFMIGKIDILIATKIVALGIDIPNVNTMVIQRADVFGLSELYQLRGRVGRGDRDGYCYLIVSENMGERAKKRLDVFLDIVNLGWETAGLKLSLKDLEMRGAGNLLGKEQTGHIYSVGFDVYLEIVREVIEELREKGAVDTVTDRRYDFEPHVEISIPAFIPKDIIPDPVMRLSFYRAFALAESEDEINEIYDMILARLGGDGIENVPEELLNFVKIAKLKMLMRNLRIYSAVFSKDMSLVELETAEGKKKLSVSDIDGLMNILRQASFGYKHTYSN